MEVMPIIESLFRWIHVIAGVLWIGLLYFFNWVNANVMPKLDAETKKKLVPELMPRALYWFRWGAAFTWVTGLYLLLYLFYHSKLALADPMRGSASSLADARAHCSRPVHLRPARQRTPEGSTDRVRRRRRLGDRAPVRLPIRRRVRLPRLLDPPRRDVRYHHGLQRLVPDLALAARDHHGDQNGTPPNPDVVALAVFARSTTPTCPCRSSS
jgi:hypothetical protein